MLDDTDCNDHDYNLHPGGPPARIREPGYYYSEIQQAYDDSVDGETIQILDTPFSEDLYFDLDKSIKLEGGYTCSFTETSGITNITGNLTISNGMVTIGDFDQD